MSLKNLIMSRVSHAKFVDCPVDCDHLLELLDIAVYAPNHHMREPWRFIIFQGEGKEKFIGSYANELMESEKNEKILIMRKVFSAPAVIAVIIDTSGNTKDDLEDYLANGAMIENLLLLLTESGLSSFWKTPSYIESAPFRSILGMKDSEHVTGLIMTGYADGQPSIKPRTSAKTKTTIYS